MATMPSASQEKLESLLEEFEAVRASLIPLLQEIQEEYHYLPAPLLRQVAERLNVPLTEVYHVATFYNCFSLEPVGKHVVQVCLGTACHVRGAPRVLDRLLRDLKLPAPGTTSDFLFTVRTVRCIGCCGLAPVIRVDHDTVARLTQTRVPAVLKRYRAAAQKSAADD
jgi:NADH:ubiquinone oxidoreductase subunit E